MSDHQRSLEDLKAALGSGAAAPAGQEPDAALEALRMEHQLEMENLKAKHRIEAALLSRRPEPEPALEELRDRLQKAERRAAEAEQLEAELRQELRLSEETVAERREEILRLQEKLRAAANRLQADRLASQDASVSTRPSGSVRLRLLQLR